jgi:hypothetical protein
MNAEGRRSSPVEGVISESTFALAALGGLLGFSGARRRLTPLPRPGSAWNPERAAEFGCMDREQLERDLQQAEKLLALSTRSIRRQELMIRWLVFDGHLEVAETAKRLRQAYLKKHATYVARRYKLVIDLVRSYSHEDPPDVTPKRP